MSKVYIVTGEVISFDDTETFVAGVHTTEEGAMKRMREEIQERCTDLYDRFKEEFEDEDYAEDYEDYDTFEEFWEDWVDEHFVSKTFWRYSDESDFTYVVSIFAKDLED